MLLSAFSFGLTGLLFRSYSILCLELSPALITKAQSGLISLKEMGGVECTLQQYINNTVNKQIQSASSLKAQAAGCELIQQREMANCRLSNKGNYRFTNLILNHQCHVAF